MAIGDVPLQEEKEIWLKFLDMFQECGNRKIEKKRREWEKKRLNGLSPTCHQVIAQTIYNGRA